MKEHPFPSCSDEVKLALLSAKAPSAEHVFTNLYEKTAPQEALRCDEASASSRSLGSLHGLLISLKDNLDVAGETTLAGGVVCKGEPPAASDALVVHRLREAGAVLLGKTNMSEFAFSGVGINPHYGTPVNPCDVKQARVPGGSSSGAAVSVALGLVDAGIGTDTGGSIRIPAALCGLVGFKSTQSRISLRGVMELSRSLDTVGSISKSVSDCLRVDAAMSHQPLPTKPIDLKPMRFAVPQTLFFDDIEPTVAHAFERTISLISAAGAEVIRMPFTELADIASLSLPAGFSPVEGYAVHHQRLDRGEAQIDPRVVARMKLGEHVTAADYIGLIDRRHAWIEKAQWVLQGFDAMLCPTVPMVAPLIQPLLSDDEAFFRVNRLLLRNPSAINYLDGCSFSLPCHQPDEMPVGLMVSSVSGQDAALAQIALAIEALLSKVIREQS